MGRQVSSIAELQQVMMEETKKAMDKSSNDLIDEIKQSIDEVVYSYDPIRYERSDDLKESLELNENASSCTSDSASITIQHNLNKTHWFSVKNGNNVQYIPEIVTEGKYGIFKGEGIFAHGSEYHDIDPRFGTSWSKPRDYMKHAKEKLDGGGYLNRCLSPYLPSYVTVK